MEKIIRLQDAKFKLLPNNNNETSVFIEQSTANSLGLVNGSSITFIINKENLLKALAFSYSLQKAIYKKQETVLLNNDWFKKEYDLIISHFQITSDYTVEINQATGGRFYLKSLKQASGLNIRNFLIQDHFKIIFSNTNHNLKIDYSENPYSTDSESENILNELNPTYGLENVSNKKEVIYSNEKLRTIIFESYKYAKNRFKENNLIKDYELKNASIGGRSYKGLSLPKYFNFEVLIGLFEEEQTNDNLKSSNTNRFINKKIKTLEFDNSYFTSQWNESSDRGLSLGNFNKFLNDVSNNYLEIIKENGTFQLINKGKLNNNSKNIIYYGAPGTGKSHKVKRLVEGEKARTERVTFHPEYDYSSFVGGYKPTMGKDEDGKEVIKYEFVPQTFTNIYVRAWNSLAAGKKEGFFLLIEEINRGNCAEIFGDIFQLLDRDSGYDITPPKELKEFLEYNKDGLADKSFGLKDGKLLLPPNLNILATMNTSDQSLFPMDSAFKRRWDWEYIPINYSREEDKNSSTKFVVKLSNEESFKWLDFIEKVNEKISKNENLGMDKCLGNYFIKPKNDEIEIETFINKAIFYLWNDVFKDETEEDSIFKNKTTYENFFPIDDENGKQKVRDILEDLKIDYKASI
jgi:hypothetical protein